MGKDQEHPAQIYFSYYSFWLFGFVQIGRRVGEGPSKLDQFSAKLVMQQVERLLLSISLQGARVCAYVF